jgi:AraC family transcriptional regulator
MSHWSCAGEDGPIPLRIGSEIDIPVKALSGARSHRAVHTGEMRLEPHCHEWPSLALHLLGSYREVNEEGQVDICGPAAVLHGAGSSHSEHFTSGGAEVLIIHFEPAWLGEVSRSIDLRRPVAWVGGPIGGAARALAREWLRPGNSEQRLCLLTQRFVSAAIQLHDEPRLSPRRSAAIAEIAAGARLSWVAAKFGQNRASLARSYRQHMGEGAREHLLRARVERALTRLRNSHERLVEIALESGFCDQAHMNRAIKSLTGRTPQQIRSEGW